MNEETRNASETYTFIASQCRPSLSLSHIVLLVNISVLSAVFSAHNIYSSSFPMATAKHPLSRTWCMFEHINWQDYSKIASFNSVEDFWGYWERLPLPSKYFNNGKVKCTVGGRVVEGYSIFAEGIEPTWEDPVNSEGGDWYFRSDILSLELLDKFWENVTLVMIGANDPIVEEICGIRVVDKSTSRYKSYRLELWFRDANDEEKKESLKSLFQSCLASGDSNVRLKIETRNHAT